MATDNVCLEHIKNKWGKLKQKHTLVKLNIVEGPLIIGIFMD